MRTTLYSAAAIAIAAIPTIAHADDNSNWSLHGFGDVVGQNDYITPRGLIVTTKGETIQVLDGLVLAGPGGLTFHAGTWTDLNPGYSRQDGNITSVNEFDYFIGVAAPLAKGLTAGVEYSQFISGQPSVAFKDEYNIEFSLKYADKGIGGLTLNPYAKLFWALKSRSSTVVTGKLGDTFDVELGAVPAYKIGPVMLSAPTWITVGPKDFWSIASTGQNFGVFSTGLKIGTALSFLKGGAGGSIYAKVQYYREINDNLVLAESLLNGGSTSRDRVVYGIGLSYGF